MFEEIEVVPPCMLVDCQMNLETIRFKEMQEVYDMKPIWHQHCSSPKFLIKDLVVDSKKIRNPYTTLLTFDINGIEIQKPFCSKVFKENLLHEKEVKFGKPILKMNLIVEIGYDSYKHKPCLIIINAESEIVEKKDNKKIPF